MLWVVWSDIYVTPWKGGTRRVVIINIEENERLKEAYEVMEKILEENYIRYTEEVLKYTYPVFIVKKDEKPELIATSIIIYLDNKFYLTTASHVLDEVAKANNFYIGVNDKIISISSELNYSVANSSNSKDDFDIAFFELDKEFIEMNKIESLPLYEENIANENTEKYFGLLCGFPVSANMNHPKKAFRKDHTKYRGMPYWYHNIISPNKENGSIVMSYGKNKKGEMPKKLRGMSGGGMWACHIHPPKLQLAGIFIEHHKKRRNNKDTLYATPIREVIQFIRKHSK